MNTLYNRTFALAFFSQIGFVTANTLMAHYARWIDFLGGDVEQIGFIMGAGSILSLLLRPVIGQWIDRFGARRLWLIGYGVFGIGCVMNLLLAGLGPAIYFCRGGIVLGAAFVFSASLAFITHHAPPERRTEAIGMLGIGGFTGMVIGPALGDLILAERTHDRFTLLFVVTTALLIIPTVLLLMIGPLRDEHRNRAARLSHFFSIVRNYWPGMIVLVQAAFGLCMTVPFVFLANYVDATGLNAPDPTGRKFALADVGFYFACYGSFGLTVRLVSRRIPELFGRRKMLLIGCVVMAAGMASFLLVDADHAGRIVIPALVCGAGHALMFHTSTSLFLETFPSEVRGAGSALSLMVLDVGMIGGAPVLGIIAEHAGYSGLFATVAAMCVLSGVLYAITSIPVWKARAAAARQPGG